MTLKSRIYDLFIANRYDKNLADITDATRAICVERLCLEPGDVVLDLGCGTGLNQPHLAKAVGEGGRIIGLDASSGMLAHARQRAAEQGYADRLTLIEGDARASAELVSKELAGNRLDALLVTLFLSVVPDWRAVFDGAWSQLGTGGRAVVMDTYWPIPTIRQRMVSWHYQADAGRPGFECLRKHDASAHLEYLPEDHSGFYICSGVNNP